MENGHLSIQQIEDLSLHDEPRAGDSQEAWAHIGRCEECRGLIERYRFIDAKLQELSSRRRPAKASMNCPDENIWFDVAGGLLSPEESMVYIQHAATCDLCSKKLRAATRIFADELSPAEEETLSSLPSSTPARQRELAQSLGQASRVQQDNPEPAAIRTSWRRFFLFAIPAVACVVAVFVLYTAYQLRRERAFVKNQYAKGRPTRYRLAGMPYQRFGRELGAGGSSSSIEVPEFVKIIAPQLAAETAFLANTPSSAKDAKDILEHALNSGDPAILNDLAVAMAEEAKTQADYKKALAILEEARKKRPDDPTIYFNCALIYEHLGRHNDARNALEQFRRLVDDSRWLTDLEKLLPPS